MPGVMSVTLKASVNSSLVPEGHDSFGEAERLTGFHTAITSRVALQLAGAAEHRGAPASVSDTDYPKQKAPCVFPFRLQFVQNTELLFHVIQKYVWGQKSFSVGTKPTSLGIF